jgi:Carboxypeptidase regulatory-like domain/TonB dependent receptor
MRLTDLALKSGLIFVVLLFIAGSSFAQFHATLQGTVSDSQGSVIPGAQVSVTDQATGVIRATVASDSGFYRIDQLPPGHYTVTVTAKGFKESINKDIIVEAELPRGFDVVLEVGQVNEQVTVVAQNQGLQSEDASIDGTITNAQIERLPEFSRDPYELIRFAPGVTGDGARDGSGLSVGFPNGHGSNTGGTSAGTGGSNTAIFQTENQQPISANGQRVTSNDYMVDGVSVNSLQWGGAATITPSIESVQEITVLASDYDVTDGRSSGAHVKVVTKSGSNDFHGGGLFQYQDPGLNAYNKFNGYNASANQPDPTVRDQNAFRQFDGNLGGPVIQNKLFFFFNYEGLRDNTSTYQNEWVETPQFDQLVATYAAGTPIATILSSPGITPRISKVLPTTCATFITANQPCAVVGPNQINIGSPTGGYGNYVNYFTNPDTQGGGLTTLPEFEQAEIAIPATNRGNQYNARVDYTVGRSTFTASTFLTYFDSFSAQASQQSRPQADVNSNRFSPSAFLSWVMTITPTISNEARFNFTRYGFNQLTSNPQTNYAIPDIEIQNAFPGFGDRIRYGALQGSGNPGIFAENTFAARDMAIIVHGRHAMHFGVEYTKEQDNDNTDIGAARPDYVFQGPWNFANGTPIFEQIVVDPLTGGAPSTARYYRTTDYGAFFQDDWKFRPNLTLNLGLRYEYYGPPTEATGTFGLLANIVTGTGSSGLANAVGTNPSQMWSTSKHNFGPRLGFAWSPERFHSKAVVRGGFGIAYDRFDDIAFTNTRNNPPFEANYGICCGTAANEFGSPFVNGQILFETGTGNSPLSYAANPALATPINSATNLPEILSGQGAPNVYATPTYMPTPYIYLYSFQVQYSLPKEWIATVGYQGSSSHKLLRIRNLQYFYPVPNPDVNAVFQFVPDTNANYNALLTEVQRRFTHGLGLTVMYTYSRSMDQLSFEGPGFVTNQTYPIDLSKEWGPSDYDMTHNLRVVGLWDLPIVRDRHDWIGRILGGWQLNGDFQFHSGFPWTPVADNTCPVVGVPGNTLCPIRPTGYSGGAGNSQSTDSFLKPSTSNFPNGGPSYFTLATSTTPGVIPVPGISRNSFRGPRFSQFDFSLMKEFGFPSMRFIGEGAKIQLRMNAYNAFNKLNLQPFVFGSSSTVISYGNGTNSSGQVVPTPNPQFGIATGGLEGRVVELEGRFIF